MSSPIRATITTANTSTQKCRTEPVPRRRPAAEARPRSSTRQTRRRSSRASRPEDGKGLASYTQPMWATVAEHACEALLCARTM
eukprot:scaffold24676_cov61-Phaeocystis_antarctica.AAC.6